MQATQQPQQQPEPDQLSDDIITALLAIPVEKRADLLAKMDGILTGK